MNHQPILLSLIVLILAGDAVASQINFNTLPLTKESGTYNGFVGASIDGAFFNIICDDFFSTTCIPTGPWVYNVSTLPGLTFARFGSDVLARIKFAEAAVLLARDGATLAGIANVVDAGAITNYQYALWALFSSGFTHVGTNALALLNIAQDDVLRPTGAAFGATRNAVENPRIFTPSASASSNQEFLGMSAQSIGETVATPEPAAIVLAGIGLIVVSFLSRKIAARQRTRSKKYMKRFNLG